MKIKCVVFDFDRTLVNLGDFVDWERARRLAIRVYLRQGTPENLIRFYDGGSFYRLLINMHEELSKHLSPNKAEKIQAAVFDVLEECEVEGTSSAQLMPGCTETLRWLKGKGVKIGIASFNSPFVIKNILSLHNLNPLVDTVVARDVRYKMKPHPDQFLLNMKMLGCEPGNSIAVGDSRQDIVAAKKGGIFAIGILTGLTSREELSTAGSEKIIQSLYELPDILITLDQSLTS